MHPLIQIDSLSYIPPGESRQPILSEISLQIEAGELVALVGANGSGKTTLVRHLNAILLPTSGVVYMDGLDTRRPSDQAAIRQQAGMVFQNPNDQVIASLVEDDVAFGPENHGIPAAQVRQRVEEALHTTGLWEMRSRPPHLLSAGQVQRLALAGILAMRPRCIVFDEPTSMLDPQGRKMALDLIFGLHAQGATVLYITHSMEEAALAQRILVLDHGRLMMDGTPADIFNQSEQLIEIGLEIPPAADLADRLRQHLPQIPRDVIRCSDLEANLPVYPGQSTFPDNTPKDSPSDNQKQPIITVHQLGFTYQANTPLAQTALEGIDLLVEQGATHGLAGATGSGKSTLLLHLNGLLRPQSPKAQIQVAKYNLNDPKIATRLVVQTAGLVMQNPELQFFEQYVGDEIAFGPRQLPNGQPLNHRVQQAMQMVGLDFELYKDRLVYTLSGGEKRKTAMASILALNPSILLLDEPTAGLDPHGRREMMQLLHSLQSNGITIVVSCHQMEELAELAQSVSVFQKGKIVLDGPAGEVLSNSDRLDLAGLEPPLAAQAAGWLRQLGWPISQDTITPLQLEQEVQRLTQEKT